MRACVCASVLIDWALTIKFATYHHHIFNNEQSLQAATYPSSRVGQAGSDWGVLLMHISI